MLKLLDSSVDLLRNNHKHGEQYYWILYYAFLSPQELKNTDEILEKLEPHISNISYRTYYRKRHAAIEALSEEMYQELLHKKSVAEIAGYLKHETSYAAALKDVRENNIHRGQLESILRQEIFKKTMKLYRYADAAMIEQALGELDLDTLDMIVIENVGNLVCPAEFAIGEAMKVTVLSVTEGEDKPLKYPLIFKESKAVLLNKVDLLPYIPFDKEKAVEDIKNLNPTVQLFEVSCTKGDGLEAWTQWLGQQIDEVKKGAL